MTTEDKEGEGGQRRVVDVLCTLLGREQGYYKRRINKRRGLLVRSGCTSGTNTSEGSSTTACAAIRTSRSSTTTAAATGAGPTDGPSDGDNAKIVEGGGQSDGGGRDARQVSDSGNDGEDLDDDWTPNPTARCKIAEWAFDGTCGHCSKKQLHDTRRISGFLQNRGHFLTLTSAFLFP